MLTNHLQHIVARSALRNLTIAMHAHIVGGIVHVVLVDDEHLAQVHGASAAAQHFALEEGERGVGPAGAAAVLVLDAGDGVLLDDGERPCGRRLGRGCEGHGRRHHPEGPLLFHKD